MNNLHFSQDQLVQVAKLSDGDMAVIDECRRPQNKLRLGYQLGFVRLFNQFPAQMPFEPIEDLVAYMSLQLDFAPGSSIIRNDSKLLQKDDFLYKEALKIEPTDSLLVKPTHFLRDNHILNPAEDTLRRTLTHHKKLCRELLAVADTGNESLLVAMHHVKCGNVAILGSKRFGKLDNFFCMENTSSTEI